MAAAQGGRALPAQVLRRALEYAAGQGLAVLLDPHDHALAADGCAHAGEVALRLGLAGIPVAAEELALARGAALARLTGARVHFAGAVECRRRGRGGRGALGRAGGERGCGAVAPAAHGCGHRRFRPGFHFQPPLRTLADRDALRAGVRDGTLAAVSADHRALDADAKAVPFARSAPGAAGFEAVLPVLAGLAADCSGAAGAAGCRYGRPGGCARPAGGHAGGRRRSGRVPVRPAQVWTVGPDTWHSAGTATPVWGETVHGRWWPRWWVVARRTTRRGLFA